MLPDSRQSRSEPPVAPQRAAAVGLVRTEGNVPFSDWLELSWFYPEGFRKERIIETERSWVVLGEQIVYKFLKVDRGPSAGEPTTAGRMSGGAPADFFRERWRLACEEILDHQALAGRLYLGLRLLRWIDDEPHWISETHGADLNPLRPPLQADDVAIVMRRIPAEEMLHSFLDDRGGLTRSRFDRICTNLKDFHGAMRRAQTKPFGDDPQAFIQSLMNETVEPLGAFILTHGSFLDPFSQLALHEVRSYLTRFIEKNEKMLLQRAVGGMVIDCHGSLRADRIGLSCSGGGRAVALAGRLPRNHPLRSADWLSDVAALSADIEARGFPLLARELERRLIAGGETPVPDGLYQFYRAAEAVRRAQLLFTGERNDSRVSATSYLALALRSALNLHGPFVVVVGGSAPEDETRIARSISELTSGSTLSLEHPTLQGTVLPDELRLEKLLMLAAKRFQHDQPVALVWPLNRSDERARIRRFAAEQGVPMLFVLCETPVGTTSDRTALHAERRLGRPPSKWCGAHELEDTPHIYVQACMGQPVTALEVLRELAFQNRGVNPPLRRIL